MFSPSFALLNGFRSSKNGWEFGFGPTFRLTKMAKGYYIGDTLGGNEYDVVEDWRLSFRLEWSQDKILIHPKIELIARGTTRFKNWLGLGCWKNFSLWVFKYSCKSFLFKW